MSTCEAQPTSKILSWIPAMRGRIFGSNSFISFTTVSYVMAKSEFLYTCHPSDAPQTLCVFVNELHRLVHLLLQIGDFLNGIDSYESAFGVLRGQ